MNDNILDQISESMELTENDENRFWSIELDCWVSIPVDED